MNKTIANIRNYFLITLSIALLSYSFIFAALAKKKSNATTNQKQLNSKTTVKKISSAKSKSSKQTIQKKSIKKSKVVTNDQSVSYIKILDSTISVGVKYRVYQIGSKKTHHLVHTIEIDNLESGIGLKILKAKNRTGELDKIHDLMNMNDQKGNSIVLAAINANFWRAITNFPIGPMVVDGEIVEMRQYKDWSSCFLDENNIPTIDNFSIHGSVRWKNKEFGIDMANHRKYTSDVVVYNKFAGDVIPILTNKSFKEILKKTEREVFDEYDYADSIDLEKEFEKYKEEFTENQRSQQIEYSFPKIRVKYLESPLINKDIQCTVLSADSGSARVPTDGCVISFGADNIIQDIPKLGDTIILKYTTSSHSNTVFVNAACGTPRLVRNGIAKHEAYLEGSHSRRFINRQLPRTAIGVNKDGSKTYFAAVEFANSKEHTCVASLSQMANIMKVIGCYDAMNLDGGGSSALVVGRKNVLRKNPDASRRISAAIAVIKKLFVTEGK
ncbi:MAG: phosphodiester glycosidase family protein [Candidatus Kapabacteria bacterium]|nr:phosphodiester glycosidase family protein [Candidatus Kapabacteria bacterium]